MIVNNTNLNIDLNKAFAGTLIDPALLSREFRLVDKGQARHRNDIEVLTDRWEMDSRSFSPRRLLLTVKGTFNDPANGATFLALLSEVKD